jgi:hypothetical protein
MKKIYLLAMGVAVSMGAVAQVGSLKNVPVRTFTRDEISPKLPLRQNRPQDTPSAMRVDLLNENFNAISGPYPSNNLPVGWSTNQVADADDVPVAAMQIHTSATANVGLYWPVPETGATPGANKFAGINDDAAPCDCDNLDSYLQTPELDFSDISNTAVQFDIFHDRAFGGGDAQLQVSTDGGATFTLVAYQGDVDGVLPVDIDFWQTVIIPVFELSGQPSVIFRFQWSDAGSWASGFAVDNVVIGALQPNNLAMDKCVFGDWNQEVFGAGVWNYTQVPLTQTSLWGVTSVVSNNGFNDQPNVRTSVAITLNGTPVSGSPYTSSTTSASLLSLDKDTLSAITWTPDALGTVVATATAISDSVESSPANNSASANLEITQFTYARDLGAAQAFTNPEVAFEYGNLFAIYADQVFTSVQLCVGRHTVGGTDVSNGAEIRCRVREWTGIDETGPLLGDVLAETVPYTVTDQDYTFAGEGNFISIPFAGFSGIQLEAGKTYLVTFVSSGDVRMPVAGGNEWVVSWLFDDTGWGATSSTPMLRISSDPALSVAENSAAAANGLIVAQNAPNPVVDVTTIAYTLPSSERVNLVVRDITGRIVMQQTEGLRQAGQNFAKLNVEQLGSGVYTYTVIAGNLSTTRQMVVR